jgi:hypothetical protein
MGSWRMASINFGGSAESIEASKTNRWSGMVVVARLRLAVPESP